MKPLQHRSIRRRPSPAIWIALGLGACSTLREHALDTLRDLEGKEGARQQSLAEVGQARLKRHPRELDFAWTARFVEDDEAPRRAYQVELHARNDGTSPCVLAFERWTLRDDTGTTFRCRAMQRWDEDSETWQPFDGVLQPAMQAIVSTEFRVQASHDHAHVMRVTLHWSYDFAGQRQLVATSFKSR
ncbi:MAG TPA: hypothetical protein PKE00_08760 [Planctomycetota bacterium]|nr:hypothetical protein [Planctomycetota bacterium]